jgi:antitoxin CcdA
MSQIQSRKSTNLSLDHSLLADARSLKINLSRAAEEGIRSAVMRSREEHWKAENKHALQSSNDFVEKNGLPLSSMRQF